MIIDLNVTEINTMILHFNTETLRPLVTFTVCTRAGGGG